MLLYFRAIRLLAYFASAESGESKEIALKIYSTAVCLLLCFQGGSLLADLASLMQESKERCIYSKLYAVCYVFRAIRCWLIRRARRDV